MLGINGLFRIKY